MNYRHHFHAGNFADVFKHLILTCLLEKLGEKASPFTYLDTHAGRGLYYLKSKETQKLKEYEFGIKALMNYAEKKSPPSCVKSYLDIVSSFKDRSIYPGSPKIAESLMREEDKMILCELHPEEMTFLKENMYGGDKSLALHFLDAYAGMKAFLPPKTARGLVMIDPPFEQKNEFDCLSEALTRSLKHWRQGHYMIWYPIKDKKVVARFERTIFSLSSESLCFHFFVNNKEISSQLIGCGVALMNPPWKLKESLTDELMPYLSEALNGRWECLLQSEQRP